MPSVDPRHSLELLGPEIAALNAAITSLTPEQWEHESNCTGWQVADLVAHVVRNGWSFLVFTRNGLTGAEEPAFGPAVSSVQEQIKASGPKAAAERQRRELDEFIGLVGGLSDADFDKLSKHTQGPRTLAWGCTQRLAEAAFHYWDLRHSLGADQPLDEGLATHLLPFMLDPERINIAIAPASEGIEPRTFRLVSTSDGSSWLVTVGPQGRIVGTQPAANATATVTAPAGSLALALYGRLPVDGPHFKVEGPSETPRQFAAAFS